MIDLITELVCILLVYLHYDHEVVTMTLPIVIQGISSAYGINNNNIEFNRSSVQ